MKFKNYINKKLLLNSLILTLFLFFLYYLGDFFFNLGNRGVIFLFIFWFLAITFSNSIIKYVFKK